MKVQIKTILIAILLTLTANAGWKPLKTLGHYGPKAFTLKKGVGYVEIRKYTKGNEGSHDYKRLETALRMYRTTLSTYGGKLERAFKQIPGKKRYSFKKGEYCGLGGCGSWYHNGFMLDSKGKQWRLENIQDVIDMVKPIDTPAEIRLVLWLYGDDKSYAEQYSAKYRKSQNAYIVKEHYVIHESPDCGDYSYQYKISRSGKITQKKLLRKKSVKECGGE